MLSWTCIRRVTLGLDGLRGLFQAQCLSDALIPAGVHSEPPGHTLGSRSAREVTPSTARVPRVLLPGAPGGWPRCGAIFSLP